MEGAVRLSYEIRDVEAEYTAIKVESDKKLSELILFQNAFLKAKA